MKKVININLLPYREKVKKEKQKNFHILTGIAVGIGVAIIGAFYTFMSVQIDQQKSVNKILKEANVQADKEIEKIKTLQDELKDSLERKKIIEGLQLNRDHMVKMMDIFVMSLPETLYIENIKQNNKTITITGITQSNAKVALLMDNLEKSGFFEKANIVEVKNVSIKIGNKEVSQGKQFVITVEIKKNEKTEESDVKKIDSNSSQKTEVKTNNAK